MLGQEVVLRTPETTYFAIGTDRMTELMRAAGFSRVRRSHCMLRGGMRRRSLSIARRPSDAPTIP